MIATIATLLENLKFRRRESVRDPAPGDVVAQLGALLCPAQVARVRARWLDSARVSNEQSSPPPTPTEL